MANRSDNVVRAGTCKESGGQSGPSVDLPKECNFPPPLLFSLYCPFCKIFFNKSFEMVVHEYKVHKGNADPYKCEDCEEVFDNTDDYTNHLAHHDESDNDYQDSDLDDSDIDQNYVIEKESESDDWAPSQWVCGKCLRSFITREEKKQHLTQCNGKTVSLTANCRENRKSTDSDGPFNCDIDGCGKPYKSKKSLSQHKRSHTNRQNRQKQYKCDVCDFETMENIRLVWHKTTHDVSRRFKCEYDRCEYTAKTEHRLKEHMDSIHRKVKENTSEYQLKTHNCKSCFYETNDIRQYNYHQLGHKKHSSGPLPDQYNLVTSHTGLSMKIKIKGLHSRKYICDWPQCLRRFKSQLLLQQHKLTHEDRFACHWPECRFRANTLAKLNDHRRQENHLKVQDSEETTISKH